MLVSEIRGDTMRRYNKMDGTGAGQGAHQSLAQRVSHHRYEARKRGEVPPLEYKTLREAMEALG
jgi:hypothetical protein